MVFIAALDSVYGGDRGVHPGSSTAWAQRQPGDDAGLKTFHSSKYFVFWCESAFVKHSFHHTLGLSIQHI